MEHNKWKTRHSFVDLDIFGESRSDAVGKIFLSLPLSPEFSLQFSMENYFQSRWTSAKVKRNVFFSFYCYVPEFWEFLVIVWECWWIKQQFEELITSWDLLKLETSVLEDN